VKLYDMNRAPNPRRVRVFLAEKGIDIPMVQIDIPSGENLAPAFTAINPRGLLPTLVLEDGTVLDETMAICRYIEAVYPDPNLFGQTPLEIAQVESWQRRCELEGMYSVGMAFRNASPFYAHRSTQGTAGQDTDQIPELVTRGKLLAERFFISLNERLGQSAYVALDRFTVADITAMITVDFARWIKVYPTPDQTDLAAWHARVSARASAKA
jgi:glutathione S-transferase